MFEKIWAGQQPMLKQYLQMKRYITHRSIIGNCPVRSVIWVKNGWIEKYFDKESIENIRSDGKRLLQQEEGASVIQGTKSIIKQYLQLSKELRDNIDSDKLSEIFHRFEEVLLELFAYFIVSTENVSYYAEKRLQSILQKADLDDPEKIFLLLISPPEKDLIFREKQAWLRVLGNPTNNNIRKHMVEFPFLYCTKKII